MRFLSNNLLIYCAFFLIFFIYFIYFFLSFKSNFFSSSYAYNELFINYEFGFIRRGLLGQVAILLDDKIGLSPRTFFNFFFIFLHSSHLILFFYFIKKKNIHNLITVIILLSPVYLLFPIYDTNVYFVKDLIIKISFLLHAIIFVNFKNENKIYLKYLNYIILPLIIFVTLFIHEYQLIFLSPHLLLTYLATKDVNKLKVYYIFFFVLIVLIFFLGNDEVLKNQNVFLKNKYNVDVHPQLGGGFKYLFGGFFKWHFFHFNYNDFAELFISIILSLWLPYIFFQFLIFKKIIIYKKKINYLLFFLPTLVTFLNLDHGRNIALLSYHFIIFYLSLDFTTKKNIFFNKIKKNIFVSHFFFIFSLFYLFMWVLNQDVGFDHFGKRNTIFQASLINEFGDFIKFLYFYIDENIISLPKIYH